MQTSLAIEGEINGSLRKRKTAKFTSMFGVEGLFHCIDEFNEVTDLLQLSVAEKWANFPLILDSTAKTKWRLYVRNIVAMARTRARFTTEVWILFGMISGSTPARRVFQSRAGKWFRRMREV